MKKAFGLLVAVMALVMALQSCTPNGAPLSITGKWSTNVTLGKIYIDVRSDDTIWLKTGSSTYNQYAKITKCTCSEITIDYGTTTETSKYELSGDTLKLTLDGSERTWTRVDE